MVTVPCGRCGREWATQLLAPGICGWPLSAPWSLMWASSRRPAKAGAWAWFSTCWRLPAKRRGAASRFCRNPTWARQIDFQGELIIELSLDGDAVLIDLTPNELARVEVTLG